ncbi:restriction endonuclease subunit S [Maribius pontilimi]|uniref:Restriction endonuclease subunit S n=1 Tax=Palleronia pontilimi TaxID=1964209 RepID=A0A934MDF6_9RHOB|nr:restriction endonuclease subunit S [Palleronia pontilimi]MBJ3763863.1 restriction endonuclease subunit S [Palleronia pontilimi]
MKDLYQIILDETPDHWPVVPFWSLYKKTKQTGQPDEELLSVYRDYGVIPKSSRDDNRNVESEDLSGYQLVKKRWLVTNKMKAWQGSIAVSKFQGIVSPAYFVYEPLHQENDDYIHFLLRSQLYTSIYGRISKGVRIGQWDLEHEALRTVPIALPPLSEQADIVANIRVEIKKIDELIEVAGGLKAAMASREGALLSLLLEKKSALINYRVTGHIESSDTLNKAAAGGVV